MDGTRRSLSGIFGAERPLVGMVHLLPLPGAPRWAGSMGTVIERALTDALALENGGMHGVLVENFLDAPFYAGRVPAETVAAMAAVVTAVTAEVRLPVGVNVLRNDAHAALAIAVATGARFVRVNVHTGAMLTDQGWIRGHAHRTLRLRETLRADVALLADVLVKHAVPPAGLSLEDAARDTWERGLADGLVLSGAATGSPTDPQRLRRLRAVLPEAPIWIGSGLTPDTAAELLPLADGAIVGSALARGGRAGAGIDAERVAALVRAAGAAASTGAKAARELP